MPTLLAPKRSTARWREEAPDYIADVFDHPNFADRYTVFFAIPYDNAPAYPPEVQYLGMSGAPTHPQGVSMWGSIPAQDFGSYRYRNGHRRIRWLDLPEHIRAHVISRYEAC